MKQYIDGHDLANEARMRRTVDDVAFVLVEGSEDSKTLRDFLDHEACVVIVAHGKQNVLDAMGILDKDNFAGALGVVDADFDRITGGDSARSVLRTDGHDLDGMLLASPALDRVVAEFGVEQRIRAFCQKHGAVIGVVLARNAMPVGCLLLISLRRGIGLDFEDLRFRRFTDSDSLAINIESLVQAVLNKSQRHDLDVDALAGEVVRLMAEQHDAWEVSRGPDMLEMLSIAFRKTLVSRQSSTVSSELLRRSLRLAYRFEDFCQTSLYESILDWEASNEPYRVLQTT